MSNIIIRRTWKQGRMINIEDLRGVTFQAEEAGHTFLISAEDESGNPVALSGTPAGVLMRADGQDVALTCSISDGKLSATLPAGAYAVPGRFALTIFLTSGGQKTAIYAAVSSVAKTNSGTVAPPAGSDVTDLINRINTAINAIPVGYNAAFAVAYENLTFPVTQGTYCIYNGALKKAKVDIATSETYTAAHWEDTNFGKEMSDLESAIGTVPPGKTVEGQITELQDGQDGKADAIQVTVENTDPVLTITDGANGVPMGMVLKLEPIQAGSGDPAPDNVRAISGHTGCDVVKSASKNQFTSVNERNPGYINGSGVLQTQSASGWIASDFIQVKPNTTYTFKPNTTAGAVAYHGYYNAQKERISVIGSGQQTFTTPFDCAYMRFSYRNTSTNIQLEFGSTATEYEAPKTQITKTITFTDSQGNPITVYGGELSINKDGTGELKVIDYGDTVSNLNNQGSNRFEYINGYFYKNKADLTNEPKTASDTTVAPGLKCAFLPAKSRNAVVTNGEIGIDINHSATMQVRTGQTTLEDFITTYGSQVIVYRLATPVTYDLTASQVGQILSLLGINNLWSNEAETTVIRLEYTADTKLFIEKLTKPTEDDMIANNAISANQFFMVGNSLFYSTASIAVGDPIKPGTNCTPKTLAEALNELNA